MQLHDVINLSLNIHLNQLLHDQHEDHLRHMHNHQAILYKIEIIYIENIFIDRRKGDLRTSTSRSESYTDAVRPRHYYPDF